MELLLVAGLIALLRWAAGRFSEPGEAEPAPPPLPAPPARRRRATPAAPTAESREEGPAAPEAPAARAQLPAVVRPAPSAHARDFSTRAALRRAVVAREVLGKPLSLR